MAMRTCKKLSIQLLKLLITIQQLIYSEWEIVIAQSGGLTVNTRNNMCSGVELFTYMYGKARENNMYHAHRFMKADLKLPLVLRSWFMFPDLINIYKSASQSRDSVADP